MAQTNLRTNSLPPLYWIGRAVSWSCEELSSRATPSTSWAHGSSGRSKPWTCTSPVWVVPRALRLSPCMPGCMSLLEDGREFVVEQLFGTPREDFVDGLNWTPLETFKARDHQGWDVTVPATAFRQVDEDVVKDVVTFLNQIQGRPFFGEDCTTFIERAFGKRRMFGDSPTAQALGLGMRVGDPALALLKPNARLDRQAERFLRADFLRALPDPTTQWDSPNGHLWIRRMVLALMLIWAAFIVARSYLKKRRYRLQVGKPPGLR